MSTDILFDKQFIRAKEFYFPVVLCGSNNCFEVGYRNRNGRMARDWYNLRYVCPGQKFYGTRNEIMNRLDEIREELKKRWDETYERYISEGETPERAAWSKYSDERFGGFAALSIGGYRVGNLTFNKYKSFFKTGMDKSLTIEELKNEGIYVIIESYKDGNTTVISTPKTTEQLLSVVDGLNNENNSYYITFKDGRWVEDMVKLLRKTRFPKQKREYETVVVDSYYTITCREGYFDRCTKRGYRYSWTYPMLSFATEKDANKVLKRISHKVHDAKVELVNEQRKMRVLKKV